MSLKMSENTHAQTRQLNSKAVKLGKRQETPELASVSK